MGSKICMNEVCRTTTSFEWKKGWGLKSGGFATLCQSCGSAFEKSIFCEAFHLDESGWRECKICGKRIHCGCIASKSLHEYMDFGGVGCISCVKRSEAHSTRAIQMPSEDVNNGTLTSNSIENVKPVVNNRLKQLSKAIEGNEPGELFQSQKDDADVAPRPLKREKPMLPVGEVSSRLPNMNQKSAGLSSFRKPDNNKPKQGVKDTYESLAEPSLNFSLSTPLGTSSSAPPFPGGVEGRDQNKGSPSQQGQRTRHILPKPPKPAPSTSSEANKGTPPQARVARPPAEGRGRNQLLPRYWPRITDQELQQISGDLNSTIVPLFEKVLSASDAGRIGRLVLPKACAEAYFPPINHSEGLPIRVQDIKGKEWTFQFRFWPNNNSRMYVLEGVTPCIQNMQLEAGDTVTFSRIDPGGKLVMGFRKATNNNDTQDPQTNTLSNGGSGETIAGAHENLAANGGRTSDDDMQRHMLVPAKKKIRNIGSKNKRLLIHNEDAMELRITMGAAQELLRPPPTAKPRVILIEDYEFEEYDEPPIFGKKTIFTAGPSGEQEQWAQCDSCSKWRRLPVHVLLPAKWSCSDNIWDSSRCSCSTPEDINEKELDALLRVSNDFKRRRITESKVAEDSEPSGLDALATAAVLGDNMGDLGETSVGATTKHPRHRVGCTCIVCIQPPSGKGKHPPSCKCNVCLTVRRRFKTMMLRKKKRQSDREAELAQEKDQVPPTDGSEMDMAAGQALLQMNYSENDGRSQNENQMELAETNKGQLDLNCHPNREDELLAAAAGMSMTTLVNATNLPLEMYLKQNGLGSLGPCLLSQAAGDSEGLVADEGNTSTDAEMENKGEDE